MTTRPKIGKRWERKIPACLWPHIERGDTIIDVRDLAAATLNKIDSDECGIGEEYTATDREQLWRFIKESSGY